MFISVTYSYVLGAKYTFLPVWDDSSSSRDACCYSPLAICARYAILKLILYSYAYEYEYEYHTVVPHCRL